MDKAVGDVFDDIADLALDDIPTITVTSAELRTQNADAGLAALAAAGVPFYRRGKTLVRIVRVKLKDAAGRDILVPGVVPVTVTVMLRELATVARWERFVRKQMQPCGPPKEVAETILEMVEEWPFPPIVGIISTPIMRGDGSLLMLAGYDEQTGYLLHDPPAMPLIPEHPMKADAVSALGILTDLFDEFPFVSRADNSAAIAVLLTAVARAALPGGVPLLLITAPKAGTGKSFLVDIIAMISTGKVCPVIAMTRRPEELDAKLTGMALKGIALFSIDNVIELLARFTLPDDRAALA
jgi:putative DNA primase/helicase